MVSPSWVFGKQGGATPASLPRRSPRLATATCSGEADADTRQVQAACEEEQEQEQECLPAGYVARPKAGAGGQSFMQRRLAQLNAGRAEAAAPLGADLRIHRSKLEHAKAEADAKAAAGLAEARKAPGARAGASSVGGGQPTAGATSLGADLRVHKSKLELAKESALAAKAAGDATPGRGSKRPRQEEPAAGGAGGLSDMKVHKSGLERAKEGAGTLPTTPAGARKQATQSRAAQRLAAEWAAWDGQPMANLVQRHQSKLEKEVAAWKAVDAKKARV